MKITVIGNCQANQLAACLSLLGRDLTAEAQTMRRLDDLRSRVENSDLVLVQPHVEEIDELPARLRDKIRFYPRISFSAFQPDVLPPAGRMKNSPIGRGGMNSRLTLYGWFKSMSVRETLSLFREEVFQKLGFFDHWDRARKLLLEEGERSELDLESDFERWAKSGCFMYLPVHPKGFVLADIAASILHRMDIALNDVDAGTLPDIQKGRGHWPVYPEIAARLGIEGGYAFQTADHPSRPRSTLLLEEFVEKSYELFDASQPDKSEFPLFKQEAYRDIAPLGAKKASSVAKAGGGSNPYSSLPDHQFWRRAVEQIAADAVDPVHAAPFQVDRDTKLATAGSCFAQHISRTLASYGYNYLVSEAPPEDLNAEDAQASNYGVFSARYGNIYTARQLLQLFDRAFGDFVPDDDVWERADGRYVDPFRPQIEPRGFDSPASMRKSRKQHFGAVRRLFKQLDVLVFTLGLTESWRSRVDGAVFPLAPGVAGGRMDADRYEFVNFTAQDVASDLAAFVQRLRRVNRDARIILTVSPVPLIATYEDRHVLVSTTYSKSVLRVAAEETAKAFDDVWYFPSYEIITGAYNRGAYFEKDLRSVTPDGVAHVMRLFVEHGTTDGGSAAIPAPQRLRDEEAELDAEMRKSFEIVCDEEAIEEVSD
jgi:hypothetical protein